MDVGRGHFSSVKSEPCRIRGRAGMNQPVAGAFNLILTIQQMNPTLLHWKPGWEVPRIRLLQVELERCTPVNLRILALMEESLTETEVISDHDMIRTREIPLPMHCGKPQPTTQHNMLISASCCQTALAPYIGRTKYLSVFRCDHSA
ncbi:hypothetical protein LINGRAHAP2_LOCUS17516 [Linum grandiflorum]